MASKYTIANAVAFLGITDGMRGIHIRTRCHLHDLYKFDVDGRPFYKLTPRGREVAATSRLWKAHQYLTERGFVVDPARRRRFTCRFIGYIHKDDFKREAWCGSHGRVYIRPEVPPEGRRWVPCELVTEFRNGVE